MNTSKKPSENLETNSDHNITYLGLKQWNISIENEV